MSIPQSLHRGDKVTILAPSGSIKPELSVKAQAYLQSKGYVVDLKPTATGSYHYFSGSETERLQDLQSALDDPSCRAILCARGGYGAVHLLSTLDWSGFLQYPKWMIGFSDISALHMAANKLGIASLHAGMAKQLVEDNAGAHLLMATLSGNMPDVSWKGETLSGLACRGELIGGNLSILCSLAGTPYFPEVKNKILFIEEVGEYQYKIDRMLWTLKLMGVFDQIAGLLLGHFTDVADTTVPYGKGLYQMVKDLCKPHRIPVFARFPAGHEEPNYPLVLGARVNIESNDGLLTLNYI